MRIIDTTKLTPSSLKTQTERDWIYNGTDCCVTLEVFEVLYPQLDNKTQATYAFSRALQGPVLEMRTRGVLVDTARKSKVVAAFDEELGILEYQLNQIVRKGVGMPVFNWRSVDNLKELFYDKLGIPAIKQKGKITVNRDALEKLESYLIARPIIAHLKRMRDIGKKISVLQTDIDPDGRIRTSYNIAGTETGRFSSSLSEFGTGGNLQNVENELRSIFIADLGMKMAYLDAEQGESRVVGAIEWNLFNDGRYLDACESGDLHTKVAILCWPELDWPSEPADQRSLAERDYYRGHSRRFMCKKLGHGSNYGGQPPTLARETKTDIEIIKAFQPKYFTAFPAHHLWHAWVEGQIKTVGELTSLTGRKRQFWGRRNDHKTIREAIAFDPQGSLADIVNRGMLQLWERRTADLLLQNHDAVVVQYPEEQEEEMIPKLRSALSVTIMLEGGREFTIPYGVKTGWNFAECTKDNPHGLKDR